MAPSLWFEMVPELGLLQAEVEVTPCLLIVEDEDGPALSVVEPSDVEDVDRVLWDVVRSYEELMIVVVPSGLVVVGLHWWWRLLKV